MSLNQSLYSTWLRRCARTAFLEPILRFFDVAAVGVVVGLTLVLMGSPGGLLFNAVGFLWRAKQGDDVAVAGAIATAALTVWALVTSIGGTVYIEAARTIRSDSRQNAVALNSVRARVGSRRGFRSIPDDARGALITIVLDTPDYLTAGGSRPEDSRQIAANFDQIQDYWNTRSGFRVRPRALATAAMVERIRRARRRVVAWRFIAIILMAVSVLLYLGFGYQAPVPPAFILLSIASWRRGRGVILFRSWAE